jgi:diaminopimelate decarboxylase
VDAPSDRRAADLDPEAGPASSSPWWFGAPYGCGSQGLTLDGHALAAIARAHGTPLYVYSRAAVRAQVALLRRALATVEAATRVHYALKANRCPALLEVLRAEGDLGIDACSPREVEAARSAGFAPGEISVTSCMPSNRDLEAFAAHGVHVNLDSLSALRRYAARVPGGTAVGLRIDCGIEVGYASDPKLVYGNGKFGLPPESFDEGVAAARGAGLVVSTLHVHCGWGLRMEDRPQMEWIFARMAELARRLPEVEVVNVGGGLGVRRQAADRPLSVGAWTELLRRHLAPAVRTIACEPGTLLVDRAGVLVVEVNTVERRAGTTWIGVDAGHNVNVYMAHYGIPIEVVHLACPLDPVEASYAVAGNINESNDVFARAALLPRVSEGDLLALVPAGAYGASMASDHCLRGLAPEVVI